MKNISQMSLGELAAYVCSHLEDKGIKVTLSGGACVSIYSHNEYQSFDLDFIEQFSVKKSHVKEALQEIGFEEEGRYFDLHKDELMADWELAVSGDEPFRIAPLR